MQFFDNLFDVLGITSLIEPQNNAIKEQQMIKQKPIKFNYRPQNLQEYIGQERAKQLIALNIKKINKIKPVHILISGFKGCGKTSLANIISKELNMELCYYIGGVFTQSMLLNFLSKNQESQSPCILFTDEVHNLEKVLAEFMYPILEDFILTGEKTINLRPFIFIGATTEKSTLIKKFAPLVDRCGCDVVLEPYQYSDMKNILKQYNDKIYQLPISEEIFDSIAQNCRRTPRIALALFDDYVVTQDIKLVLDSHRIIRDSLTDIDIKILHHLAEVGKPVGEQALSALSNMTVEDYRMIYEPLLIQENYLSRTMRGRIVTDKGRTLLNSL